jgi:c-di-GMP-binding flagellar brake protein YcgR
MKIDELQVGTKLELEPLNADGKKWESTFVSEFEWAEGENAAMIAAPINEGVVFPIHAGTYMNIYFIKRDEGGINFYRFRAVVTGRGVSGNLALLKVEVVDDIEKVQRRSYYRLDCSLSVLFRRVSSLNPVHSEDIPFKKTLASNLSGGGIRLLLEEKIEAGKLIECEISTGEEKTIRFYGKVVRCDKRGAEGVFKYEAGIAYIKINEKDREAIVKFIFDEQRKLRKKGLI